jgi:hypothetical protein
MIHQICILNDSRIFCPHSVHILSTPYRLVSHMTPLKSHTQHRDGFQQNSIQGKFIHVSFL